MSENPGDSADPNDPLTSLAQMAAASHEFFLSLQAGGFSEYQALYLTGQMLISASGQGGM